MEEDEYQKHRKRISRRKPLPPIDLQGISHSFSLPRSNTHQHSSFSNVKPRHQFMKPYEAHAAASASASASSQLAAPISPPKASTSAAPLSSPSAASLSVAAAAAAPLPKTYSTYHCCYCLQIHVEKNRSCTSTLLWLCMLLLLISAFSILTVFLSHYYFGLFSLSRHEMQFLNKFYTGSGGGSVVGGSSGKPWMEPEWLAVPTDPTKLVRPPALLLGPPASFPQSIEFMQSALAFAQKHDLDELSTAVFPHGADVVNALGVFPNAQSVVLFGSQAVPALATMAACDAACLQLGSALARKAGEDLETEGFVLPKTLKLAGGELGVLPVLLASIQAVNGEVAHLAEINVAQLRCLHLHVLRRATATGDANKLSVVYCGALDEKSEDQRVFLRNLLKAQPLGLGLVLRGTGYKLFANLKAEDTAMFNLHLKAMLMSLAQVIVQDDSGIPFHLLQKHFGTVELFGKYRGLGDPELSGLERQSGSVIRSMYQKDLAELASAGPLPFRFGYRMVIGPADKDKLDKDKLAQASVAAEEKQHVEFFQRRKDFKGAHLILAKT